MRRLNWLEVASSVVLSSVLLSSVAADESCTGKCSNEGYPLPCGVWLKNETKTAVSGTYELGKGVVEMFCAFSSLPEPVSVQWMFRPAEGPGAHHWREFPCASKEEKKLCKTEEKLLESKCVLRTSELRMSGSYRCYASIPNHLESRYKAYSSEFAVHVVGIEKPKVIHYHLPHNRQGHVDVEICANPKPEIYWITPEGILRPHERSDRFATTSLQPRKVLPKAEGPAQTVPYCFATRLIIHRTHSNDSFNLMIRGELDTINERVDVRVAKACRKATIAVLFVVPIIQRLLF